MVMQTVLDGIDDSYFDRPEVAVRFSDGLSRSAYQPGGWMRARPNAAILDAISIATGLDLIDNFTPTLAPQFIQFATGAALNSLDFQRLLRARFSFGGRIYTFSDVRAEIQNGDSVDTYLIICFNPEA
jgi:hypothetical protein